MPFQSPFNALRNQFRRPRYQIADTQSTDATSGTLSVGQFSFNPAAYPAGTGFNLTVTFSVSDGALTGQVLLYNVTDGEVVTNSTLTTSSTAPDGQTSLALPVGGAAGDLKLSAKVYEARISVSGATAVDMVSVGSVALGIN
jgi:hypothetical protein